MTRRLLLSYLTLTLVVLLLLELPLAAYVARSERRDLTARLERDAVTLASYVDDALAGSSALPPGLEALVRAYDDEAGARVVIVDAAGVAVLDTGAPEPGERSFATRPEIGAALAGGTATGTRASATLGTRLHYVAVPVASAGRVHGAVRLTFPASAVEARIRRAWLLLAAVGVVVLGIVGALGLVLARTVTEPLRGLEHAAAAAGAGNLGARAPVRGPPEVQALARSFNAMAATVEGLVGSQEAFVADASHELRTPLAALRLRLENLERDVRPEGRDDLEGALEETARLAGLIDGLLALARAEGAGAAAATEAVDVGAVARARAEAWGPLADERSVRLLVEARPDSVARGTPGRLEQVVDNLLANALDVSPEGAAIRLWTAREDGHVELHVVDEGPGLAEADRERAFDRFWRGRTDREGSGLGLAISRRLLSLDGGEIALLPAAGGGIDARVRLPAAPAR